MRSVLVFVFCLVGSVAASAAERCPGNPDALGTSRVLTINPADFARMDAGVDYELTWVGEAQPVKDAPLRWKIREGVRIARPKR